MKTVKCSVCDNEITGEIHESYFAHLDDVCKESCDNLYPLFKLPEYVAYGRIELLREADRTIMAARCRLHPENCNYFVHAQKYPYILNLADKFDKAYVDEDEDGLKQLHELYGIRDSNCAHHILEYHRV